MALKDVVIVDMYLNPTTNLVEKITCITPFGMTERVNSDWDVTTREESGIDDLAADKVFRLNWDTDFVPMDAEDGFDDEHAAILLFDKNALTEEECLKYGTLRIDPAGDAEAEATRARLNAEGK